MTMQRLVATLRAGAFCAAAAAAAGCAGYRWTSTVPEDRRTAAPMFENRTAAAELGPAVTRHIRRELQREGTFSLRRTGDAAVEIQGAVVKAERTGVTYDRGYGMRAKEYRYTVTAEVSFIDKVAGKVMVDGRQYVAQTTFLVQGDVLTGQRNAADRIANDLARQIADDAAALSW